MAIDFAEIGERLRAYRRGAGLSPDQVARHLKISRAALYNYEKGGVIKLDTIERLADLLGVSKMTLLGDGVEHFRNPVVYFERKRQVERRSDQLFVCSEPISILLSSPDYPRHLHQMLRESIPAGWRDRDAILQQVEAVATVLQERREERSRQSLHIVSVLSAQQLSRFIHTGLIGTYDLPPDVLEQRRMLARREVERIATMLETEPMGIQIGVVEDMLPSQTFEIFRQRDRTTVAVSPFRLGEFPNIRVGVATMTSAVDAVASYDALAQELWSRAHRGSRGAAILQKVLGETPEQRTPPKPRSAPPLRPARRRARS